MVIDSEEEEEEEDDMDDFIDDDGEDDLDVSGTIKQLFGYDRRKWEFGLAFESVAINLKVKHEKWLN